MRSVPILVLLALALATPPALAAWGAKGSYEPDTSLDVAKGFNHFQPDWSPTGSKVYFNAIQGPLVAQSNSLNPNSALLQTGVRHENYQARALLGVWKDCNKDGFIGFGDQGLFEYRTTLLTAPNTAGEVPGNSVCPVQSIPSPIPRDWKPVHNDGEWVHEFLPIGWDVNGDCPSCKDGNPWNVRDDAARVWADEGIPRADQGANEGGSCYVLSHPRGTFDTVGSIVRTLDCNTGEDGEPAVREQLAQAPGGEAAWDQVLAVENPWGHEEDASYATGFDCTSPLVPTTRVGSSEVFVTVPGPGAPAANAGGSVGGTLNETETQFGDCERENRDSTSVKNLPYSTETDISNDVDVHNVPDYPMRFEEGCRVNAIPTVPYCNVGQLGRGTPGVSDGVVGVRWSTEGTWGSQNYLIGAAASDFPTHVTFYAYVSPAAVSKYGLTLPKGAETGKYGAEVCAAGIGAGQPEQNGWACNPTEWWPAGETDATGTALVAARSQFIGVRVGQDYNLRDTDCYDWAAGPLRAEGLTIGGAVLPLIPETEVTNAQAPASCA